MYYINMNLDYSNLYSIAYQFDNVYHINIIYYLINQIEFITIFRNKNYNTNIELCKIVCKKNRSIPVLINIISMIGFKI